jgi:hypothetical protein
MAVEQVLLAEGLVLEVLPEGGFRLTIPRRRPAPSSEGSPWCNGVLAGHLGKRA